MLDFIMLIVFCLMAFFISLRYGFPLFSAVVTLLGFFVCCIIEFPDLFKRKTPKNL